MEASVFGPMIDGFQVQEAVLAHLSNWALTYFAEIERQRELSAHAIPLIRSWTTTPREPERWPEDQLPAVLCVNTRTADEPEEDGDGQVGARWLIGIGVIVEARSQELADRTAKLQFAALRAIMLQHPSLGDFAEGTEWLSESYDILDAGQRRTLGAAYGIFGIAVGAVADRSGGIAAPLADPYEAPAVPAIDTVDRPEVVKT